MKFFIESLSQLWIFRRLVGGHWVKLGENWVEVHVARECEDGSVFYRYYDEETGPSMFHETFIGIREIER